MPQSKNTCTQNPLQFQSNINIVKKYCEQYGLEVLEVTIGFLLAKSGDLEIGRLMLFVKSCKHLGVTLMPHLYFHAHIKEGISMTKMQTGQTNQGVVPR